MEIRWERGDHLPLGWAVLEWCCFGRGGRASWRSPWELGLIIEAAFLFESSP